jgi:hypothetical protein
MPKINKKDSKIKKRVLRKYLTEREPKIQSKNHEKIPKSIPKSQNFEIRVKVHLQNTKTDSISSCFPIK